MNWREFWKETAAVLGTIFVIWVAVFGSLGLGFWLFPPSSNLPQPSVVACNGVCEALWVIESGKQVIKYSDLFPPFHRNRFSLFALKRFSMEMVSEGDYADSLPPYTCLAGTAVKITDNKTGYAWVTNGFSPFLRIS